MVRDGMRSGSSAFSGPHPTHPRDRRASYAYRAAKAVEGVARRMSSGVFSVSHLEEHLEKEIKWESEHSQKTIDIIRLSGEKILHSRKVLFLIVLLNIIDCALVLGELILDIHFVKDMVHIAKDLTLDFVSQIKGSFPWLFTGVKISDVHIFYNELIKLGYDLSSDVNYSAVVANFNQSHVSAEGYNTRRYTLNDLPRYIGAGQGTSLEEDIAHAFHKASISILGVLTLITLLKIVCYGTRFFRKKMELLDGFIVISSFVLDLVFIKGLIALPLEDAVEILAFLIPWRVVRVANSLVMAVTDQAHLKLKVQYTQKKKIARKLEHANNYNFYYKQVLLALREFCHESGISRHKFHDCVASVDPPEKRKTSKTSLRKHLDKFQCLGVVSKSSRESIPSAVYTDHVPKTEVDVTPGEPISDDQRSPLFSDRKRPTGIKSVLHTSSGRSSEAVNNNHHNHHHHSPVSTPMSTHSVHFNVHEYQDSESEDSDIADSMFLSEILKDESD